MPTTALFIVHKTKPGKREAVKAIWLKHMAPAVQSNPGHLAYFYNFDNNDADSICAFQQYASPEDAKAFLETESYLTYLAESKDLLEHEPKVFYLSPQWSKVV